MIYDLYTFKDGEVTLEFKFARDEKNISNKNKFLKLLEAATKVLTEEIEANPPKNA